MQKPHEPAAATESTEVEIAAGRVLLKGTLRTPAVRSHGMVLFVHGSGSSRHSPRNQFVADHLLKAGMSTLLFDLLTEEEEHLDAKSGQWRFDIELLAGRLLETTGWVRASRGESVKIGYFGASTGGGAALVAAARLEPSVAAVVSRGGRPDLADGYLDRVTAATLLLVGARDTPVIRLNEMAYEKLVRCPKELTLIPGATHLFEEPGTLAEVARLAAIWFNHYFEEERDHGN